MVFLSVKIKFCEQMFGITDLSLYLCIVKTIKASKMEVENHI